MQDPTPNLRQSAAFRSLKSNCPRLAPSCWDIVPVVLGLAHCAAVVALAVSFYNRLYNNWTWMFNGYHAEHHYCPKVHWTQMVALHRTIGGEQKAAGVRVISCCHALGFLDSSLPARYRSDRLEV